MRMPAGRRDDDAMMHDDQVNDYESRKAMEDRQAREQELERDGRRMKSEGKDESWEVLTNSEEVFWNGPEMNAVMAGVPGKLKELWIRWGILVLLILVVVVGLVSLWTVMGVEELWLEDQRNNRGDGW
ncbi:MAG: hypothetical protein ACRD8U_16260 [Pyrinomonadaceae bacterium]